MSVFNLVTLFNSNLKKESFRGVLKKMCFENMHQIYRRTPMPKCACTFAAYFQNTFSKNTSGRQLLNLYICRTCCVKCQKGKVLCQAVLNKSEVFDLPVQFQSIRGLEKVLIAKRLLFTKVTKPDAENVWNNM